MEGSVLACPQLPSILAEKDEVTSFLLPAIILAAIEMQMVTGQLRKLLTLVLCILMHSHGQGLLPVAVRNVCELLVVMFSPPALKRIVTALGKLSSS